jgi:hypothetical protein
VTDQLEPATQPAARPAAPPPRSAPAVRASAVLGGGTHRVRRRPSLPRLLLGAGAVVAAVFVVVALLRPHGPLDPPLDVPSGRTAGPPAAPTTAPGAARWAPAAGTHRVDGVSAAIRLPAPPPLAAE